MEWKISVTRSLGKSDGPGMSGPRGSAPGPISTRAEGTVGRPGSTRADDDLETA